MRAVSSPAITLNSFQSDAAVLEWRISGDIVSYSHVLVCGVQFLADLTNRVLTECL